MLSDKRITLVSDTIVDDVKIASYGAVIYVKSNEMSLTSRYADSDSYEQNMEVVRDDRYEFESFAYELKNMLRQYATLEEEGAGE